MLARAGKHGFRRRPLAMTSLIDVIFLLLLFFMLTSTFSKYAEVELLSAGAGNAQTAGKTPVFLRLEPEGLSLNGQPEPMDDLANSLGEFADEAAEQMVLVSLDDAVTSQRLVDLLAILRSVRGIRVQVLGGN